MKKRTVNRIMTAALAMAMVFGCASAPAMTAKADYVTPGGNASDDHGPRDGSSGGSSSGGSSSSSSRPTGGQSASSSLGSSSGSTGGSGNYDVVIEEQHVEGYGYVEPNYTPGAKASAGKQDFRVDVTTGTGTCKVIHKGDEVMAFTLKGADGKAKACSSVSVKQNKDGKWEIDFAVADATGCTVGAPLDRTYMFKELGVSYVTINDVVIIDIEAEAAAAAEAAK